MKEWGSIMSRMKEVSPAELAQVEGGMAPVLCVMIIAGLWGIMAGTALFGGTHTVYKNGKSGDAYSPGGL